MTNDELTTKAARCPVCKKFHLIASLESFNSNDETKKEFTSMMLDGFQIVDITTDQARNGFGYCDFSLGSVPEFSIKKNK